MSNTARIWTRRTPAMNARDTTKTLTEKELAQVMQAYFRRFVTAAWIEIHGPTGEPVVRVEFVGPKPETH